MIIVAGEASGDIHGANLVRAMLTKDPSLTFSGMGGSELKAAGVELLFDAAKIAVVGVTEVISHLGDILKARRALINAMQQPEVGLLVLIDYPDFNLLLAAKAKKIGIPIFYYISPQVWAWRSSRVHKLGRLTNRVGVILPFEKSFYAKHGYEVDFVGHPLMDAVKTNLGKDRFLADHSIPGNKRIIGLLPGSRKKEVCSLLPIFLKAAALLCTQTLNPKDCVFLIPQAPTIDKQLLDENGVAEHSTKLDIRVIADNRYDLMAACDCVVAASGTVTLELAILETPTIATYRVSPRTYRLGRLLIRHIQFFSLVNLIAEREIIPELLQDEVTPENIAANLAELLQNAMKRESMRSGLREVKKLLGQPGASARAADIGLQILETST